MKPEIDEPVQFEWGEWEEKGALTFTFCVLFVSLPGSALVQLFGKPLQCRPVPSCNWADKDDMGSCA